MQREENNAAKFQLTAPLAKKLRIALVVVHMVQMQECRAASWRRKHGCRSEGFRKSPATGGVARDDTYLYTAGILFFV